MSWNENQRHRLAQERAILKEYFPQFKWEDPTGNTYVYGMLRINSGNSYGVMITLPGNYPASKPSAYIYHPKPLRTRGPSLLQATSSMHTLSPDSNGYIQVCHYNSARWTESITLYKVILKVRLWLEAYEGHLATGNPIDHYLSHMG